MKILAIRGCNLASLAGEFEIDLANGPLGVAGVFAIVGPTGAGKSTLLDAMCVALFDRTPRLPGHSRVTVGHGDEDPLALGAQDPRTLLRRGATQGWAEVDFESGDTRRYRARWSVRRARDATDGNLQDQQISLTAIDMDSVMTERLGGTKTETLKAIHQRLGLTFDQFRRSALLAQGEFAAFLRAEGKDRSELLERMTGTEIYSKLSIAAHTRAVLAEQALRERQAAALAIVVLDDDRRANARSELELARVEREAARHRLADAEKLAVWRGEAALRAASLAQAETEHGLAEAEARGAEPLRSELVLRRRAEALRAVWDEAARLDRQHSIAQGDLARAAAAATAAESAKMSTVATHARIADLHATIRAARMAAAVVELDVPKRLARGTIASPALPGGAVSIAPPIRGVVGHAEERAHAALEPATWLVARRGLAPEILAWPELDAKLGQARSLAESIAAADRALADQTTHHAALVAKAAAVQRARELAQHKLLEATREAEGFVKRRTLGLDAAGRAEDEARTRCGEVERLITISGGARTAANILTELESRLHDLETEAAGDRTRRAQTEKGRDEAAVLRDERARVVAELRKAAGYQHARTELVDEEPCPLCGAIEHPWKYKGAFDTLIADAERTLAEATTQWESATKLIAQLDARDSQRDAERARFASTRSTAQTSVEALAREWGAQLAALGELSLVTDPAHPAAERLASERAEAARTRLESARATRSAAAAAHKAVAEAQARVQVCQADLDHHLAEAREIAATLATITAAVERIAAERASRIERHAELARELDTIVARWEAALPPEDRATVTVRGRARGAKLDTAIAGASVSSRGELARGASGSRTEPSRAELVVRVATDSHTESSRGELAARAEYSRGELAVRGATDSHTESSRGELAAIDTQADSSRGALAARGATDTRAESSRGELAARGAIDSRAESSRGELAGRGAIDSRAESSRGALAARGATDTRAESSRGELAARGATDSHTESSRGELAARGPIDWRAESSRGELAARGATESRAESSRGELAARGATDSHTESSRGELARGGNDSRAESSRGELAAIDTQADSSRGALAARGATDTRAESSRGELAARGAIDSRAESSRGALAAGGAIDAQAESSRGELAARGAIDSRAESSRGALAAGAIDAQAESSRGELAARGPIDWRAESSRGALAAHGAIDAQAESSRGELAARGAIDSHTESSRGELAARAESSRGELVAHVPRPIDRTRFADLVLAWRDRAAIVADAEASLVAALVEVDRAELDAERAVADTAARHAECAKRSRELAGELVAATTALDDARIAAGFDREALHRALADDASRVETLAAELDRLGLAVDRARTRIAERTRLVADHEAARPMPQVDRVAQVTVAAHDSDIARARAERIAKTNAARDLLAEARARVELDADRVPELAAAVKAADQRAAELAATLAADDDARRRRDEAFASFKAAERAAEVDRVLGQVIGSHDGKLFRSFAQSLTLDQLLCVANSHLEELAPRYQLERVPKHDLELQVIDRDFGGEVRSVQSLSGGESFLVSLALALGLSSMSAHDVRVRTLLIDEGFGTLDPATLDSALAVLDELQATGRQVGIISHVPALLDRVRAHVRVTPRGGGRSDVHVPAN